MNKLEYIVQITEYFLSFSLFSWWFYEIGLALITYLKTNNFYDVLLLRNTTYGSHTITIILFLTLCVLAFLRTKNIFLSITILLFAISYHELIFNIVFLTYYSIKYNFELDYVNYFVNFVQYIIYFIISFYGLHKAKLLKELLMIQFYNWALFLILAIWILFGFSVTLNTLTHQINNTIANNMIEITYSLTFLLPYYIVVVQFENSDNR